MTEWWAPLAAFAYDSFQKYGRGMVRILLVEGGEWSMNYVAPALDDSRELKSAVENYDPEHQVVFLFNLGDEAFWELWESPPLGAPTPVETWHLMVSTQETTLH